MRPPSAVEDAGGLRAKILELGAAYMKALPQQEFIPGESYIPASGKVLDADDLGGLLDASLDMWLTAGRFSRQLEVALARRIGVRKACLTVSGSAANLLAFSALTSPELEGQRIEPGSEVITVAAGFPTTVAPIVQNQCVPVFVDVDMATHNIDVTMLDEALSTRTRAIMVAHALGNPGDLGAITAFAEANSLYLIEDTCDALGATYDDRNVGTFGDLATVSFYPAHQITTGEGGAVFGSPALLKLVESFRDWGRDCWCEPGEDDKCGRRFGFQLGCLPYGYDHKYTYSHLGYNMKMTDMQAAIGLSQLDKLDQFVARRRVNHDLLSRAFVDEGLDAYFELPRAQPRSNPSWFGFALTVRSDAPWDRNQVVRFLEGRGIGTRLMFGGNLTKQPAFENVEYRTVGDLENTDRVMDSSFWIGVWPGIGNEHIDYMVEMFKRLVAEPPT